MSTAEVTTNKATFRRFHDAMNSGDADLFSRTVDEVVQPDLQFTPPVPIGATGAPALKQVITTLIRAFPDLHVSVEDLIGEGDRVVGRSVVTGTHQGEFMGLAPTGRSVRYGEIFIFRFADGRVAEIWGVVDVLSQMRQLGLLPA